MSPFAQTVISTMVGTLLGGLVTWLASRHYYLRNSKELQAETARLRKLVEMVLRALEEKGLARLHRDAGGKIAGLVLDLKAALGSSSESREGSDSA